MDAHDQILLFLKATGPTIPSKVAKTIGSSILIASAHLSDLASREKIKISNLKMGSSPLYFLEGQEEQLFSFAKENLNPKDYDVLENLKNQLVLRENDLDLLSKVALRQLKDFAIPLQVRSPAGVEFFWKWHLLPAQDASSIIGNILRAEEPMPEPVKVKVEEKIEEPLVEEKAKIIVEVPEEKVMFVKASTLEEKSIEGEASVEELDEFDEEIIPGTKLQETHKEESKQESISAKPKHNAKVVHSPLPLEPKQEKLISESKKEDLKKEEPQKEEHIDDLNYVSSTPIEKKTRGRKVTIQDEFIHSLEQFLKTLNIKIDQKETIRKNKEMNLVLRVPSIVGEMTYFCKAKDKARCDEKDLSTAYMEARIKKLPLLFLYTKELNKKAQEMLESDAFQNALVKKIG
ncbi:hypothetical protein COV12_03945 [Candidatus Woesearchaeota archaeon CG10_big_fil_rev_8_21_14_0_10_32_24]|nr:MAG: hypothetical protein COV12_03945 [Candidatus Woesearchaeota archaeon CG10_big_fil_rev_8_21_14_0_10_32_24]